MLGQIDPSFFRIPFESHDLSQYVHICTYKKLSSRREKWSTWIWASRVAASG
jgi:hypothetical protein